MLVIIAWCTACGQEPPLQAASAKLAHPFSGANEAASVATVAVWARLAALGTAIAEDCAKHMAAHQSQSVYTELLELEAAWPRHDHAVREYLIDLRDALNWQQLQKVFDGRL